MISQEGPLSIHFGRFMRKVETQKRQMLDRILLTEKER